MSHRIGKTVIITETAPEKCTECDKIDELRPYGPNMAKICYECSQKNPELTQAMMHKVLFGVGVRDDN